MAAAGQDPHALRAAGGVLGGVGHPALPDILARRIRAILGWASSSRRASGARASSTTSSSATGAAPVDADAASGTTMGALRLPRHTGPLVVLAADGPGQPGHRRHRPRRRARASAAWRWPWRCRTSSATSSPPSPSSSTSPSSYGDFIVVGDFAGTVEHVGLKTTRLRSLSGEQLVFSNSDLLQSRIRNYKRMHERRIVFAFGVVYQTPPRDAPGDPGHHPRGVEARRTSASTGRTSRASATRRWTSRSVYYILCPDYNVYMDLQQAINLEIVGASTRRASTSPTRRRRSSSSTRRSRPPAVSSHPGRA